MFWLYSAGLIGEGLLGFLGLGASERGLHPLLLKRGRRCALHDLDVVA